MSAGFPYDSHPCWAETRASLFERIHLPIAKVCNLRCAYCDTRNPGACHTSMPGSTRRVMSTAEALSRITIELEKRPNLRIVAVSGPGDPLASEDSYNLLQKVRQLWPKMKLCLSTNGTNLVKWATKLADVSLDTISVTVNAVKPDTAAVIYKRGVIDSTSYFGKKLGAKIIDSQYAGIKAVSDLGILVKVNTILIPLVNMREMDNIAQKIAKAGASLQNIIPLIPNAEMRDYRAPTIDELLEARNISKKHIPQFTHCKQCRSDVVGVPGNDTIL